MKSLLEITSLVLLDCSNLCGVNPYRDLKEIAWRVEHEGESFLTITLPTLAAGLEKALSEGHWSSTHASAFTSGRGRSLPQFLGGFFDQVFDSDGALRQPHGVAVQCIWAIRQVCRVVSKLFLSASSKRVAKALRRFVGVEKEVRDHVSAQVFTDAFKRVSAIVWSDVFSNNGFGRCYDDYHPRHGPGTTAEAIRGNRKFDFHDWPMRLEREFPFTEFGVSNILNDVAISRAQSVTYTLPRDELPVKVTPVPKTAKTPRIIAIEPVAMQYMQQAIADWLRPRIESLGRYTAGHVNFSDQSVNNQLARSASFDGKLATLDMSDASDRVSCKHVAWMLKVVPGFARHVFACRSTRAILPNSNRGIPLSKFASMGSALCFPMEAMVFYCAIITSRIVRSGRAITPRTVSNATAGVYVYGDDLIVPVHTAPSVIEDLELFGLKVNAAKSFWTGKFRESCGGDYYGGVDVTPVYCRRKLPDCRADVKGLVSAIAFANQLYWAGMWKTSRAVRSAVEKLWGTLPSVAKGDQLLGWESYSNARSHQGWHGDYQRPKSRGLVAVPVRSGDVLDDDPALLKCFRIIGLKEAGDPLHLSTSVRYGNLALKRRWT
jgi:hypothetical protein